MANETTKALELDPDAILAVLDKGVPNLQLPDPILRNVYMYEQDRVIWLEDEVDDYTLSIAKKIMQYNKEDRDIPIEKRKPIRIFIDTPGGSVDVMMSIISAIKMSKTPVWTINWCRAMSAGSHILAAGHKRFAMPGSTVLIHSGSCTFSGTAEQADSAKKYYDAESKLANDQLLADTKIDSKTFKRKSPNDWYITAEEAVELGIVDKIVESFEEIM